MRFSKIILYPVRVINCDGKNFRIIRGVVGYIDVENCDIKVRKQKNIYFSRKKKKYIYSYVIC